MNHRLRVLALLTGGGSTVLYEGSVHSALRFPTGDNLGLTVCGKSFSLPITHRYVDEGLGLSEIKVHVKAEHNIPEEGEGPTLLYNDPEKIGLHYES